MRLIDAATELLGEVQPGEITVRMIARRAGLQHSLITRHFGSRDVLLGLALAGALDSLADEVGGAPDIDAAIDVCLAAVLTTPALSSAMGVLISQGTASGIRRHALVDALQGQLTSAGVAYGQARETALLISLNVFGWAAAEPWWLDIAGRQDDPIAAHDILRRGIDALIAGAKGNDVGHVGATSAAST